MRKPRIDEEVIFPGLSTQDIEDRIDNFWTNRWFGTRSGGPGGGGGRSRRNVDPFSIVWAEDFNKVANVLNVVERYIGTVGSGGISNSDVINDPGDDETGSGGGGSEGNGCTKTISDPEHPIKTITYPYVVGVFLHKLVAYTVEDGGQTPAGNILPFEFVFREIVEGDYSYWDASVSSTPSSPVLVTHDLSATALNKKVLRKNTRNLFEAIPKAASGSGPKSAGVNAQCAIRSSTWTPGGLNTQVLRWVVNSYTMVNKENKTLVVRGTIIDTGSTSSPGSLAEMRTGGSSVGVMLTCSIMGMYSN